LSLTEKATLTLDLDDQKIGVDEGMEARFLLPIQNILPHTYFFGAGNVLDDLRMRKDDTEIAALRKAGKLSDAAYKSALAVCREGATERQIAAAIAAAIIDSGAELSFDPIVAAGANSAMPHHSPSDYALRKGDIVILDLGAKSEGYCGDISRVLSVGEPGAEALKIYDIVRRAHQAGVDAARPGVTAESVDIAARSVIDDAGYGQYFVTRTGHGIGLDDHEQPNIVGGNKHILRPREAFSIEPGIYIPGKFGMRVENIAVVSNDGVEIVNETAPTEITIV
jgi:Xaa-Pro dipeptidase